MVNYGGDVDYFGQQRQFVQPASAHGRYRRRDSVYPFLVGGRHSIRNCECYFAIAATAIATCGFVTASTAAAANNLLIDGCYIHGDAAATLSSAGAITLVGGDYVQITNNFIYGKFAGAAGVAGNPITNQTTAGTRWFIGNNVLVNLGATNAGNMAIAIIATTGAIVNNRLFALGATAVPVTATAIEVLAGNYWAGTVDTAGALS